MDQLNAQISLDPYDFNLWCQLVEEAHITSNPDIIRNTFERVLEVFPNSVQHWMEYIEYEIKNNHLQKAESLFTRCTTSLCSLSIFKLYLQYIKNANSTRDNQPRGPTGRKVITQAFEFVLHRAGYDREAGPVWLEYIALLKTAESHNSWEQQQSVEKIRRVYQQCLSIPTLALDIIWKEYEIFENSLNRVAAKKILGEKHNIYVNSKNALKEVKNYGELLKSSLKVPSRPPTWSEGEVKLAELWRNYLLWEKTNPLNYEKPEMVRSRIIFAFNQSIIAMRFYPEFWVDFGSYYLRCGKKSEALLIYKAAIKALPLSLLVNFSYAEFEEKQKHFKEAHEIYSNLIGKLTKRLEDVKQNYETKLNALKPADKNELLERSSLEGHEIDGEHKEMLRKREKLKDKQRAEIESIRDTELGKIKRDITLVWIAYMKSARRSEGIKGLRRVFGEARKSGNVTYHLFVESAWMEYYHQDDPKIPENIFQYGQRFFSSEPGYIAQYLEFLMKKKDTNNTRALFERSIDNIPIEKALELWEKISRYEADHGEISNLDKLEARIFGNYSLLSPSCLYVERTNYLDIHVEHELGPLENGLNGLKITATDPAELANILGAGKRSLLDSVDSEEFSRPDFSKWTLYKPSQDQSRPATTSIAPPGQPNVPPSNGTPTIPGPTQLSNIPIPGQTPLIGSPSTNSTIVPPVDIPPALGYFLTQIPPAIEYSGPMIPPEKIIELLSEAVNRIPGPDQVSMGPMPPMHNNFPNPMSGRPPMIARPPPNFRPESLKRANPSINPNAGFAMGPGDPSYQYMTKRSR